jgi:8-oxo-dGTP pyrophosphatase MutT (NUDIX family)
MKPDQTRRAFAGKQISVDVELWGDTEREIVRHPGAVAIVAVDTDDRVVLVRQPREPARERLLELPAGTREPDEEPIETARRELAEEVGLRDGEWRLAATFFSTPGFCDERVWVYVVERAEQGDAAPEDNEQIEIVRIPVSEIESRLAEIDDAKTLAGLLLYLRER